MNLNITALAAAASAAMCLGAIASCAHHKSAAEELRAQLVAAQISEAQCVQSVVRLEDEAKEREAAAKKALAAAQSEANRHARRADKLLRQPAAVPGDDCASARVRARAWLGGRR